MSHRYIYEQHNETFHTHTLTHTHTHTHTQIVPRLRISGNTPPPPTVYFFTARKRRACSTFTYSMVQSPSWEASWFAASQEIPRISRNPEAHYRTHKRLLPVHPACECFITRLFYREGLLAPRSILKLEDHPLSAVRDCLFNPCSTLPVINMEDNSDSIRY